MQSEQESIMHLLDKFYLDYYRADNPGGVMGLPVLVCNGEQTLYYGSYTENSFGQTDRNIQWKCAKYPQCQSHFVTTPQITSILIDKDKDFTHSCLSPICTSSKTKHSVSVLDPKTIDWKNLVMPPPIFKVWKPETRNPIAPPSSHILQASAKELIQTIITDYFDTYQVVGVEQYNDMIIYFWSNLYQEPIFGTQKMLTDFFQKKPPVVLQPYTVYQLDEFGSLIATEQNAYREHPAKTKHRSRAYRYLRAYYADDEAGMDEFRESLSPVSIIRSDENPRIYYFVCKRLVCYKFLFRELY